MICIQQVHIYCARTNLPKTFDLEFVYTSSGAKIYKVIDVCADRDKSRTCALCGHKFWRYMLNPKSSISGITNL